VLRPYGINILHLFDRVYDQIADRDVFVPDAVDERRVGPIFEQTANEVGEQSLMGSNRRVDAAGAVQLVRPDDLVIKLFAHAVQALKFVIAVAELIASQVIDRRQGLRIMGGKLREDSVARGEQFARAGDIADIRMHLAGKHRESGKALNLGAFYLAVPIGAFYQTNHDPMA